MRIAGLISALITFAMVPLLARADAATPLVVAHWLVPMTYTPGENAGVALQNDIRAAAEMGVDAFALDTFSGAQAGGLMKAFISAADSIHANQFRFFLSADMARHFAPEDIVGFIKKYGSNPYYLKVNGKPLLSTYGGGTLGDSWWQEKVLSPLREAGTPVTFIPNFERANPNGDTPNSKTWMSTIANFPSVDGLFNFLIAGSTPFYTNDPNIGKHWWSLLEAGEALADALRASNKLYMASVMPYYWAVCHPVRQYLEFQGGRGMDNLWTSIITKQHPQIVQLVTWNDYSESTFVQPTRIVSTNTAGIPSMPHLGYYELMKYYIAWYHTGVKPTITTDSVFYFYRTHRKDAVASNDSSACKLGPISSGQKWGKIDDVIYVTTAIVTPAQLIVKIGSSAQTFNLAAGLNTIDVPFTPGKPIFELWRNGKKAVSSVGTEIVENPLVYNFNVNSGYMIADGVGSGNAIVNRASSDNWSPTIASHAAADWFNYSAVQPNSPTSVVTR